MDHIITSAWAVSLNPLSPATQYSPIIHNKSKCTDRAEVKDYLSSYVPTTKGICEMLRDQSPSQVPPDGLTPY